MRTSRYRITRMGEEFCVYRPVHCVGATVVEVLEYANSREEAERICDKANEEEESQ